MKYFILNICCKICIAGDAGFKITQKRCVFTQGLRLCLRYVSGSPRPLLEHTTEKQASCLTRKCLCFVLTLIRRFALVWLSVSVLSSNSGAGGWVVSCGFCTMTICLLTTGHLQRTPLSPSPKYCFLKSAHKEFAKLEAQLRCICSGFKTTYFLCYWDFPWSRFYSMKRTTVQNWFLFSRPPRLFLHPNRD